MSRRAFILAVWALSGVLLASKAIAAGPFGNIHVGNWNGGAYTSDSDGSFSHCAASANYKSGVTVLVSQNHAGWLLGFAHPAWQLSKGETFPVDVTFDGQAQFHFFGTAANQTVVTMIFPPGPAMEQFRKAHLMAVVGKGQVFQFDLTATGQLLPTIANCYSRSKTAGVANAGDFSVPIVKPVAVTTPQKIAAPKSAATPPSPPKVGKLTEVSGTGFVVSMSGHVVTNNHVISGCVGDIDGKLNSGESMKLRTVSTDETNDLALLQSPSVVKDIARIRGSAIHPGDGVTAIGYPYHGLLTSDFTVTTGIVSSLSGILNDTRYLQISAPIQPGNSGGPLLDTSGDVVGVVSAKINTLKFAKITGDIPENINFAIKTGAVRDFLDNSVVPYKIAEPGVELKTADIANNARAYTMLISCSANAKD